MLTPNSKILINLDNVITEDDQEYCISAPILMKTCNYYVGAVAVHVAGAYKGLIEPWERSTDYMVSEEDAQSVLDSFILGDAEYYSNYIEYRGDTNE